MSYFLEILYEDSDLVIINKPSGLSVHGGNNVKYSLMGELRKRGSTYELLHRLDRETSGVLALVKNKKNVAKVMALFNKAQKYYWVIVHGRINKSNFLLQNDLLLAGKKKKIRVEG